MKKLGLLGTIFTMTGDLSPVPCLDTMKIHIQHLIDWIVDFEVNI